MNAITLIFPHQLFKAHPAITKNRPIFLVEEWLFFSQYAFHKQKLILHRSGMQFYADNLEASHHTVHYIPAIDPLHDIRTLIPHLFDQHIREIHLAEVTDNWLLKRLQQGAEKYDLQLVWYPSPAFIQSVPEITDYFGGRQQAANGKVYFQTDFYIHQRKMRKILLEAEGRPKGGQWSFDAENRLRFPKNRPAPALVFPQPSHYSRQAEKYVELHFPDNYGQSTPPHYFACNFEEAESWLQQFIEQRFQHFGAYEDAIVATAPVLHHSVLSPMLNCGLLTPGQVLNTILQTAEKHRIPLNSLEGFIRQLIGWREFVRIIYEREGGRERTTNYWKFKRKIPHSFWTGTTGILPVDITIRKVLRSGYCHHIERLMVLGNFMLLCEFDPDEVYRWFMELFIDSYDWVMVPNVYGMSQFADGGLITTKPYISGSNYLLKMGDYQKGEWQTVWDGLFWRFMDTQRIFFGGNPRLSMLLHTFDKMSVEKKSQHLANAENYLKILDHGQTS